MPDRRENTVGIEPVRRLVHRVMTAETLRLGRPGVLNARERVLTPRTGHGRSIRRALPQRDHGARVLARPKASLISIPSQTACPRSMTATPDCETVSSGILHHRLHRPARKLHTRKPEPNPAPRDPRAHAPAHLAVLIDYTSAAPLAGASLGASTFGELPAALLPRHQAADVEHRQRAEYLGRRQAGDDRDLIHCAGAPPG